MPKKNPFHIDHQKIEKIIETFNKTKISYIDSLKESREEVNNAIDQYNSVIENHNQLVADMHSELTEQVTKLQKIVENLEEKIDSRSERWKYSDEGSLVSDWFSDIIASKPDDIRGFATLERDELEEVPDIEETVEDHLNHVEISLLLDNCTEEPDKPALEEEP